MKTILLLVLACTVLPVAAGAPSTIFTYQGRLAKSGAAPTGSFDFQFALYDAATDGSQVGDTVTVDGVAVANGLFTVALDFGLVPFTGADRWLEIAVRETGKESYTPLAPRQPLTPTPYALFARAVNWDDIVNRPPAFGVYTAGAGLALAGSEFRVDFGATSATVARGDHTHAFGTLTDIPAGLADGDDNTTYAAGAGLALDGATFSAVFGTALGTVARGEHSHAFGSLTGVPAGLADGDDNTTYTAGSGLSLTGAQFSVAFAGNGSAATAARSDHAHATTFWQQDGNAFGEVGVLGTIDNYALELKVYNSRALRIEPNGTNTPNIILGYSNNAVTTGHYGGAIGGGYSNQISADVGTIDGGYENTVSEYCGAVGGGRGNAVSGMYGTIPGGLYCAAGGITSFAAGYRAKALHNGSFVWGDYQYADISSSNTHQFIVRALGGIWLGTTSSPSFVSGRFLNTSTGAYLSSGGAWTDASDRNLKTGFAAFDRGDLLAKLAALPITSWRYKTGEGAARHLGPTAQDFRAAFGLGLDDVGIATVDGIGVALAAIQGLQGELRARDAVIARQQHEIDRLRADLDGVKQLIATLTADRRDGAHSTPGR